MIALAGVAAAVGFVAGAGALAQQRDRARCAATGAEIERSWNDEIRGATRDGFTRDAPPFAAGAWDKSAAWIDRYADAWRAARIEICTAATIERRLEPELEARALTCMQSRRRVLDALLRELAKGGEAMTIDIRRRHQPAPGDRPVHRPRPRSARARWAPAPTKPRSRCSPMRRPSSWRGIPPRRPSSRARPSRRHTPPMRSRSRSRRGCSSRTRSDGSASSTSAAGEFERAYYLAGRDGDDAAAALAASEIAATAGFDRHDVATAERWIPLAEMSLGRLGEEQTPRAATVLYNLGRAELGAAHTDRAEELFERSLAIDTRELAPGHPQLAEVIVHLGIVAIDRGDYARNQQLDAKAIAMIEASFGADHPAIAAALNNMGLGLDARGRHAEALEKYEQAHALWQSAFGEDHPHTAEVLQNIAVAHYEMGDYDAAMRDGLHSLAILERTQGPQAPRIANALNNLVNYAASKGDFAAASEYQRRALAIHEATLPADHPDLAASLTQAGLLVAAQPDPDAATLARARSRLERALAIWQQRYGDDHPDSSFAAQALGVVLTKQGEPEDAIVQFEHALRLRKANEVPVASRAETCFALAGALRAVHRDPERVRTLASEALELYRGGGEMFAADAADVEAFLAAAK